MAHCVRRAMSHKKVLYLMRMRCSPPEEDRGASVPQSRNSAPRRPIPRKGSLCSGSQVRLRTSSPYFGRGGKNKSNPERDQCRVFLAVFAALRRGPAVQGGLRPPLGARLPPSSCPSKTSLRFHRNHVFFNGKYPTVKKTLSAVEIRKKPVCGRWPKKR